MTSTLATRAMLIDFTITGFPYTPGLDRSGRRPRRAAGLTGLGLATLLGLGACGGESPPAGGAGQAGGGPGGPPGAGAPQAVGVVPVTRGSIERSVSVSGVIE
ncbi:MAG: hypothetical protein RQ751_02630, partial [Longimicrobiales bacterium]|nr:hypothetical protein [Longimicrobiales bacterium]